MRASAGDGKAEASGLEQERKEAGEPASVEDSEEDGILALALSGAEEIARAAQQPEENLQMAGRASFAAFSSEEEPRLRFGEEEAAGEEERGSALVEQKKSAETADYVIANVDTSLNIRVEPSTESEIVGKLYRGAKADIVERGEEWTRITSGTVKGYVSNDYLMFDDEAVKGAEVFGVKNVYVETDALRIRRTPGTDGEILDLAEKGAKLQAADVEEAEEGWVAIDYSDDVIGYVSADYVTVRVELEEAISIEEEMRLLEEKRKEEQRAAQEKEAGREDGGSKKTSAAVSGRNALGVGSEDAYLLAAVVHMEAGNEPYEGKLAVANVVVNRLLSGKWGSSLYSVIYAPNQFPGAASGLLARYMNEGPNAESVRAASEALNGVNNIGNYLSFCSTRVANYGAYSSYTIIGNHCFYLR